MSRKPKILLYDIETEPNLAYVWAKYQQDVIAFEREWQILSFSYKWRGQKKIHFHQKQGSSDKSLCKKLHDLFNRADLVIGHNSNKFDNKKVMARLIFHGFPPPKPFATVDTLVVARKYFKFNSNRLNDLGVYLGIGEKTPNMPFSVWEGCIKGSKKAWNKMKVYNKRDIELLEGVYDLFLPWMQSHPNLSLLDNARNCPTCGSDNLIKQGRRATHKGLQQQFKCYDCGGWCSVPYNVRRLKYGQ